MQVLLTEVIIYYKIYCHPLLYHWHTISFLYVYRIVLRIACIIEKIISYCYSRIGTRRKRERKKWYLNNEIKLHVLGISNLRPRKIRILSRWIIFASCILEEYSMIINIVQRYFFFPSFFVSPKIILTCAWLKEGKEEQRPRFYKYRSFDRIRDRWSRLRVRNDRLCKY